MLIFCLRLFYEIKNKETRCGKLTAGPGVFLLQNNTPVHKSAVVMAAIHRCGFQLVEHSSYSLDLIPSDLLAVSKDERSLFQHPKVSK